MLINYGTYFISKGRRDNQIQPFIIPMIGTSVPFQISKGISGQELANPLYRWQYDIIFGENPEVTCLSWIGWNQLSRNWHCGFTIELSVILRDSWYHFWVSPQQRCQIARWQLMLLCSHKNFLKNVKRNVCICMYMYITNKSSFQHLQTNLNIPCEQKKI